MRKAIDDVAAGRLALPLGNLRERDELHDMFQAVLAMVRALREREEGTLAALERAQAQALRDGNNGLAESLGTLASHTRQRLG